MLNYRIEQFPETDKPISIVIYSEKCMNQMRWNIATN